MDHFYQGIEGWFDFEDIYRAAVAQAPSPAHFVEVGAFLGRSTCFLGVEIINSGKAIELDVVDTFRGTPDTAHMLLSKMDPPDLGTLFEQFRKNTAPVWHALTVIPLSSLEAARLYADGSLDFIFIDANHDYEAVRADIAAWLPKLRPGGHLGGHDYSEDWPGVVRAVDEAFGDGKLVHQGSWLVSGFGEMP